MATPWTVPRDWVGETVAVLASGPSMSREVAETVRGRCRVIAISNQGVPNKLPDGTIVPALAPWADVLYAADAIWWRNHKADALAFAGLKVTISSRYGAAVEYPEVFGLQNSGAQGFDERPTHLRTGGNSGYQAAHLAAHFGARRVLLCGLDMKVGATGSHWFGEHSWRRNHKSPYAMFIQRFTEGASEFAKRGVEILNCTPGSALKCFPFVPLSEALK